MRRSFDKSILPHEAPPKNKREYKRKKVYKTKRPRYMRLEILMQDYKEQAGEDYNVKELAYRCSVHQNSARMWFYGFCPHPTILWNIAKYFEEVTGISAKVIHKDLQDTIEECKS